MLTLETLTLRNFISVGNVTQTIQLNQPGLTLVVGQNLDRALDDTDHSRNGAGKTTFFNALCYVITGNPLTNIRLDNLINKDNGKDMLVTLEFSRDQHHYRIERGRRPSVFRFLVDNKEVISPSTPEDETHGSPQDTQAAIDAEVGLTPVLLRLVLVLTTYADHFFRLGAARQREVVEEIFNITLLSEKANKLRDNLNGSPQKNITGTRNEIKHEEFRLKTIEETNARFERTIADLQRKQIDWTFNKTLQLDKLRGHIAEFESIDIDGEIEVFERLEQYTVAHRALLEERSGITSKAAQTENELRHAVDKISLHRKQIRDKPAHDYQRDLGRYRSEISDIERRLVAAHREQQNLNSRLQTLDDLLCKTCGQSLKDTDHLHEVTEQLASEIAEADRAVARLERNKIALLDQIEQIERQSKNDQVTLTESNQTHLTAIAEIERQAERLSEQYDELEAQRAAVNERISALGEPPRSIFDSKEQIWQIRSAKEKLSEDIALVEKSINPYDEQVAALQENVQDISYTTINKLLDRKEHEEFLLKMLSDKNSFIRKSIIEQNLAFLNYRLDARLEKSGLPHEVKFMSDLSVDINRNGKELDFDNLSRGEQNRVLLSLSLAFRDLYENIHTPINALFMDEVLDFGNDGQFVDAALAMLFENYENRGKSAFVISNREDIISKVGKTLYVMKENNFTTYEPMEVV